jgi:indole-3-glycerol phosphate synthase
MRGTILEKIIDAKRKRVDAAKRLVDMAALADQAYLTRVGATPHRFRDALANNARVNIIAEFKRASPSKGIINDHLDPAETAIALKDAGAAAISVLTEEDFFNGSMDDLAAVRNAVNIPILRKDFIIDDFQIYESAAAGADAVLLIVAGQSAENLQRSLRIAHELGLDAIVEVHDRHELDTAVAIGADIIGVNNRNLKTFEVSLDVSRELIKYRPKGVLMITESGISGRAEINELRELGFNGFLIGEALMRSGDAARELRRLAT